MRSDQLTKSSGPTEARPRGIQHILYFGIFFIFGFGLFGYPFWYLMRQVLPHSISLANESSWFSPPIAGGTSVHYAGFVVPLVLSIIALVVLYAGRTAAKWTLPGSVKALIIVVSISFLISQYTVVGIFVSVGLTDPILLVAFNVFMYNLALHRTRTMAALVAYPVGFTLGFLSDLESVKYIHGVFGGWGLGDGDFVFPVAFVIATLLFSLTWKRVFNGIQRLEFMVQERITRNREPLAVLSSEMSFLKKDGVLPEH